jgi:threonine/homoserine/homoserine lactone efflux protein
MTADWVSVLTELIPLALVIALSPLSIIPAVLILQTPRPRSTGLAFLVGWLLGLGILTAIAVRLAGLMPNAGHPTTTASWARIVIGALLITFGAYRWFTRKQSTHEPGWMRRLTSAAPHHAFAGAAVLAVVNPKVLFMCIAAGVTISTDQLNAGQAVASVVYFVLVAGSSVIIPVLVYAAAGHRLDPAMAQLGAWLHRQHAALVAGILIVIGILMVYKGVHHL